MVSTRRYEFPSDYIMTQMTIAPIAFSSFRFARNSKSRRLCKRKCFKNYGRVVKRYASVFNALLPITQKSNALVVSQPNAEQTQKLFASLREEMEKKKAEMVGG